jgi:putative sigma-54 modulation protein
MIMNFTARQTKITTEIRNYCEKRIQALEKLMGSVLEVDLIFSVEKYRHKVEMNVKAKGASLTMVEVTHDMLKSLNLIFDNLEKKIKKEREKFREKKRRKSREKKTLSLPTESVEIQRRVVRSEYFSPKPMALEEALIQFDLKKKEVFVFRKLGSEKWAVLFQRKDGHYGLVEPE